ncbi:MAG: hemolysin III family protein, partial [Syntrophomonadaceae bacterium]|nr:hemolysin III family protein [Syntrophomonadaceae bacterium]
MLIGRCRDPVSGLTHLVGVVLSVVGAVLLFIAAAQHTQVGYIVEASIFGASLLLLETDSTLSHLLP